MQRQKTAGRGTAALSPEHRGLPEAGGAHPDTERDNSLGVMSANSSILEIWKLYWHVLLAHRAWNQWKIQLAEVLEKTGFRARKKTSASHSESCGSQLDSAAQTSQSCLTNA